MSSPSSDSSRETEITLYNPSSEEAEELDPSSMDRTVLDLEIDRELAERLLEVSKHLGLNPTLVASRAIDLVCEEIGTLDEDWRDDEDEFGTVTLIQRYQARVDLLQVMKEETEEEEGAATRTTPPSSDATPSAADADTADDDEDLWEAVGEIKDLLDEDEIDGTGDAEAEDEDDFRVKKDESPPTEELAFEGATLEHEDTPAGRGEAEPGKSVEKSSRWSAVTSIMNVFSGSNADEASETGAPPDADGDDPASSAEITVDEAAKSDGALEEHTSDERADSEEDVTESKDWDAVETIIEAGEQAKQ